MHQPAATPPKAWDPSAQPRTSSLRNTPDATPDSSLRGGTLYKAPSVGWEKVSAALDDVALSRGKAAVALGQVGDVKADVVADHVNFGSEAGRLGWTHVGTAVDARDVGTPDDWVPRHPALVRLTGKHPFNCEPPCDMLLDAGFITPPSLHYVRNHGKCPKLDWDTHSFTVGGLVGKGRVFTMQDLVKLPSVTLPVTLVCAGNRRKEQNMTKQTIGFSWGISAHACNHWTGVRVADLLRSCDIDLTKARHVEFVGVESEGLPNGTYGTSIPISLAMDMYGDVLIAYEQNGMRLMPDHGFPVRVVIPGWIGGRMVKWLEKIIVTDKPSENFYHFNDNRILPPHVDAELAKAEGWWYRPEYLFNELNINSAINYPNNGEVMTLNGGSYTIKGYAYSGGGRKVTRVELSFDGGKTWKLCELDYPEERHSHAPANGKYWCWMFWEYTVDKFEFFHCATGAGELRVRAWDVANNTQPSDLTWNLMGMGNNCHFRVKVQPVSNPVPGSPFALEFLHPTVPGPTKGGWMPPPVEPKEVSSVKAVPKSKSTPSMSNMIKTYTMDEVAKHDTEDSAWFVMEGGVYDATRYLKDHPGGAASIVMNSGGDATEDFLAIHSAKAKGMLEEYFIGDLVNAMSKDDDKPKLHVSKSSGLLMRQDFPQQTLASLHNYDGDDTPVALNPKKWQEFELIEKKAVSHDTRLFRFKLQSPEHKLGLPVGYHMFIQVPHEGKMVMRAYTPVSSDDDLGEFTLCIKVYFANVHPKFPEGGKLSQYMEHMAIGDMLKVKGPLGHFEYLGRGRFINSGEERTMAKLGLICGGTGLTPAYQVMKAVCKDLEDKTEVCLLYANQSADDILMRAEIEAMAASRPGQIKVWYTLDRAPDDWEYSTGFINEEMLRAHLPAAGEDSFVGMCGPPPMINYACIPNLVKMGYTDENYMCF
jgi:nitrate reductase (NAD(P)H)